MHICGIYILGVISMTSSFCSDAKTIYGLHVNFDYLPPKIEFGAFLLKLAHKMRESPDPHRLQWTYRSNCTDTIYAILMTSKRRPDVKLRWVTR